ncbi:MAG: class I SAM-dependent methyltransferase [Alphaproteobacteria bacterium]|nr:class I SAM-dependent methyltransferase [Alphaproteobacteria bacterium]
MTVEQRVYFACQACAARFLHPLHRPSHAEELDHYRLHENDPDDPRYRAFLSKLVTPLLEKLPPNQTVLDYGAGPGPALAAMLTEAGHHVALYDPFFSPGRAPLAQTYDAITCTETVEHFHDPASEFQRFNALLKPGGWLGLMTCFQTDDGRFATWHYRKDPTHVVFYRRETFHYIAVHAGWTCEIPVKDVVLMRKSN